MEGKCDLSIVLVDGRSTVVIMIVLVDGRFTADHPRFIQGDPTINEYDL